MRFFTRQLYQDFNLRDEEVADRADQAWEKASKEYRAYLKEISNSLPSGIANLTELKLHDAEILSRTEAPTAGMPFCWDLPIPLWSSVAIITLRLQDEMLSLIYFLWDHIREHPAPDDWPFSKIGEHWLYEELDIAQANRGPFWHRILLSSGVELEIPFASVVIHRFNLHPHAKEIGKKQSA